MGARLSQAERFRRHNQEMKLALAENIPLAEASWRLFKERLTRRRARPRRAPRANRAREQRAPP
jgi:peptidoglycan/LPS O-acetylase OafA/YrhL